MADKGVDSSGWKTGDAAVSTESTRLMGYVIKLGTSDSKVIFKNGTTGGDALWEDGGNAVSAVGDVSVRYRFSEGGLVFPSGIYADVSGTGANYAVLYRLEGSKVAKGLDSSGWEDDDHTVSTVSSRLLGYVINLGTTSDTKIEFENGSSGTKLWEDGGDTQTTLGDLYIRYAFPSGGLVFESGIHCDITTTDAEYAVIWRPEG